MKTYLVTIKASVCKTMTVYAESEDEAVSCAEEEFSTQNVSARDAYNEEVISVEEA